jgi:hypothetical protein
MKTTSSNRIHSRPSSSRLLAILGIGLGLATATATVEAAGAHHRHRDKGDIVELKEAEISFEYSATDRDMGIGFSLFGDDWTSIVIFDPRWRKVFDAEVKGSVGFIGLAELKCESAEPSLDDLSRDEFLALCPEGEYKFFGRTTEGNWLAGLAPLTHAIPEATEILFPTEGAEVDAADPFVVTWTSVPDPIPGTSAIVRYQVVIEEDGGDEKALEIDIAPNQFSLAVPQGFLEPGKEYEVELLAIESGGNKSIRAHTFSTAE